MISLPFLKKQFCPIGVDVGSTCIKMVQMSYDGRQPYVVAAAIESVPAGVSIGSSEWQHWAVGAIKRILPRGRFHGRKVVAGIPSEEIFIDQIKVANHNGEKLRETVISKMQKKLPFEPTNAMIKYVVNKPLNGNGGSEYDVLVMAGEKVKIERHLAIYERVGLEVGQIGIWPSAVTQSYTKFFAKRASDIESVAMLISVGANHTNVVICKYSELLFARVIPIGALQIVSDEASVKLTGELTACLNYFESIFGKGHIERLLLMAGQKIERQVCDGIAQLAQQMEIPAQMGDILAAVDVKPAEGIEIDRRSCRTDWVTAIGLSLS